jgi:hypothetical protein
MSARHQLVVFSLAALTISAVPGVAAAGTIELHSFFQGKQVGVYYEDNNPFVGNESLFVFGSVLLKNPSGLPGLETFAEFEAYCVEMFGPLINSASVVDPNGFVLDATVASMTTWSDDFQDGNNQPIGVAGGGPKAAWLYNKYNALIQDNVGTHISEIAGFSNVEVDTARSALGVAIWEVLYEDAGAYGVEIIKDPLLPVAIGNGRFFVHCDRTEANGSCATSDAQGLADNPQGLIVKIANAMLSGVGSADAPWLQVTYGTDGSPDFEDTQDFIGPAPVAAPEPASVMLLGTGIAALIVRARRKQR